MSDVFLDQLGLPTPDAWLGVGAGSHAEQTANVMLGMERELSRVRPSAVVVVGDVNSTLGAALSAAKLLIPVAHVEAGLRSFDRTMPEETNRVLTDAVSDTLFAPSSDGVDNLRHEGVAVERIFLVGNVMIDSLERILPATDRLPHVPGLELEEHGYLLVTLHRPSNVDDPASLEAIMETLQEAAKRQPVLLVAHPRTARRLRETGLEATGGLEVLPPLGYVEFISLMRRATGVMTDSGGVQEETTVLGVPCITLRENTERPITITDGTNELVGTDRDTILDAVDRMVRGDWRKGRRPELWDGHAGERIAEVLVDRYA
jgi:UDP-N-acetylglucosamine 2-epimerase (non-hydrolysing)